MHTDKFGVRLSHVVIPWSIDMQRIKSMPSRTDKLGGLGSSRLFTDTANIPR
jgi:hypothetical protein